MAKSGLSFDRYLQRLTIRGCQVLCSLFLLFSLSGALEAVNAQTLVWPFRDGCHDGYDIRLRFFDLDNDLVWPSSTHVYILRGTTQTYRLNCTPRAKVCYGAEDRTTNPAGYWGVGIDNDEECEDCCYRCPISGVSQVGTDVLTCDDGGNDAFGSRTRLSEASGRVSGSNDGASKESGEPNHADYRGGASVWWTWTAPATGTVTFNTRGSDFDTLLAVYTGSSVSRLTEIDSNDDAYGYGRQSEVSFRAVEGRTYHIAVDGYGGATGDVVLNWEGPGGGNGGGSGNNDAFASRIRLSGASGQAEGSNDGASKESGEPNHAGSRGGASVWWTWTAPATGTATFDTRGSDFDTLLAVYTGSRVNRLTKVAADDDTHGRQSEVSFRAVEGRTYHVAVDGYGGATGDVVLNWQGPGDAGIQPPPDPGIPGDPSDGLCISGETITHSLPDGHVAVGHRITRIAVPNVSGLTPGEYGNRNSNGDQHGRWLNVRSSGNVWVTYYDNGTRLASCDFDSEGNPYHYVTHYSNGKYEGVRYWFSSDGSWEFYTYRAGTKHGPSGGYDSEGNLRRYFTHYSNGKYEGVRYWFSSDGSWEFYTHRAGTKHGPYGSYNSRGQKHGSFGSYTNGNRNPGEIDYNNGEPAE